MKRTLMMTVAMLFAGHMAFAAISTDTVAASLTEQGYTKIEIKQGPTQIKVEAIRGTETLEVVYDIETGSILKQETGTVEQGEDTTPGIEVSTGTKDFVDGQDGEDGQNAGNDDDDNDNAGSDDDGDDQGDDNGNDDEGDDDGDHGGSGHDGGGDSGGDDSGGDD